MWRQQVLDERELHAVTHARPVTDQLHDLRLEVMGERSATLSMLPEPTARPIACESYREHEWHQVTQHARQRVEDTRYEISQQVRPLTPP